MDANVFISILKADTAEKCKCDLQKVFEEYKSILSKLPAQDRGLFGLNVLRTLCWNIDKAPRWRDNIDGAALLTLAIDSIRQTREMARVDRVKTLACIYHIHKYAVKLTKNIQPELVLKVSVMPFELDSKYLLKEYHKTYWHILADRLAYIETLKTKVNIANLLPKVTTDVIKVLEIYDTVQFCSTVIVFLFKKLHMLYSDKDASKLVQPFKQIFSALCQKDVSDLKQLPEADILDVYVKLNDCLYVVADNSAKLHFKDGTLVDIAEKCVVLVAHRKDLFHCLHNYYVNLLCKIICNDKETSYIEAVFDNLEASFQEVIKPEYEKAMLATYPYLNQLLRLYIEYKVTNGITLSRKIQENCLKLILFFVKKLKHCSQILKCENCPKKTGLHDAFRLSLLIKHFAQNIADESILNIFYVITTEQYTILAELEKLGCVNYQKFFRKLQTDIHNTAISLNKAKLHDTSIKLFDNYLRKELQCTDIDHKNISRGLFNKSICEFDSELYEFALIDAFLSLIFARQEGLKTDKYMSLVMDIKSKELKSKSDDEVDSDEFQLLTVLDACKMVLERKMYGDLTPFLAELKFSVLLRHEFSMYAKLWPSVAPIGGVWRALHGLAKGDCEEWITVENETEILNVLYDAVLETPSAARNIHSAHFSTIVEELLDDFDNSTCLSSEEKLVHVSLMFLQCEYELNAASLKYKWKTEPSPNPDNIPATRTLPHEHAATTRAVVAVRRTRDLLPTLAQVSKARVSSALQIFQVFVPLLQHLRRDVEALQLAHYCCLMADVAGDRESYLRNAGVLLTSSRAGRREDVLRRAASWARREWGETDIVFLCEVAIYYESRGASSAAAKLLQTARSKILEFADSRPDINLDMAVGRLLEAQHDLHGGSGAGPGALTALHGALRHYLGLALTGTRWSARRVRTLSLRVRTSLCAARACAASAALGLRPRARAAAAAALPAAPAPAATYLHTLILDATDFDNAQIKLDQQIKNVLGLDGPNEPQPSAADIRKQPLFTPKQGLETMRDNVLFRKTQNSPSEITHPVPAFKMADFFNHHPKCTCYACEIPTCVLLSCKISNIEAVMYAFANENKIARNYFQGGLNLINIAQKKLSNVKKMYKNNYDDFVVESAFDSYERDLKMIEVRLLIDVAFFELKNRDFEAADERVVEINEIVQEMTDMDQYLKNDVLNLMAAAARLKKTAKKPDLVVEELESQLSPKEIVEPPKTPECKPTKPPKPATKKIVKKEELPQERGPIERLNFEDDADEFEKPKTLARGVKKDRFKIPKPIIPKATLEEATPRPSRSKPRILISEPSSDMATPISQTNKENVEFFTPIETPEQFFTPLTSVKTYAKRSLRQNIVKNLEQEFSTPGPSVKATSKINEQTKAQKPLIKSKISVNNVEEQGKTVLKEENLIKEVKSKIKEDKQKTVKQDESSTVKGKIVKKDELNVPKTSRVRKDEKRNLVRAVSPGKVGKEREKSTKSRRQI